MVERKYLTIAIFVLIPSKILAVSAWLPRIHKYKCSVSSLTTDKASISSREERVKIYQRIENIISDKYSKIFWLNLKKEQLEHILSILNNRLGATANETNQRKKDINHELYSITVEEQKLLREASHLKLLLLDLYNYAQEQVLSASIEYSNSDSSSFGVGALYSQSKFTNSEYTSTRSRSKTKSFELFYKYKILQQQNFVLSTQIQFSAQDYSGLSPGYSVEMFLLAGKSSQKKYGENFTEVNISAANGILKNDTHNNLYSFAIAKGTKFSNNFTISSYTKYTNRRNCHRIYKETIYEQLSVAKTVNFANNVANTSFTVQIGYFWDRSLKNRNYQTSGIVFSLWTEA
ncbi:MAG: hypothetical protein ACRYE9_04210 [Janthinobacterium lividum]